MKPRTTRIRASVSAWLAGVVALWLLSPAAVALDIVLVPGSTLAANADALAAANQAIEFWEDLASDPVTVTIDADFWDVPAGTPAGTQPVKVDRSYADLRSDLIADAAADESILDWLPTSSPPANLPTGFQLAGSAEATKANLKALGVTGLDAIHGASDALVFFNLNENWDYDQSDGVTGVNFLAVAVHEIGHVLGFLSATDEVDRVYDPMTPPVSTIYVKIQPLDLLRFPDTARPANPSEFQSLARTLMPGEDATLDDTVHAWPPATGFANGDGTQASHWKAGLDLGVMKSEPPVGEVFTGLSPADRRAIALIGWDLPPHVPALSRPATLLLITGLAAAAAPTVRGTR